MVIITINYGNHHLITTFNSLDLQHLVSSWFFQVEIVPELGKAAKTIHFTVITTTKQQAGTCTMLHYFHTPHLKVLINDRIVFICLIKSCCSHENCPKPKFLEQYESKLEFPKGWETLSN